MSPELTVSQNPTSKIPRISGKGRKYGVPACTSKLKSAGLHWRHLTLECGALLLVWSAAMFNPQRYSLAPPKSPLGSSINWDIYRTFPSFTVSIKWETPLKVLKGVMQPCEPSVNVPYYQKLPAGKSIVGFICGIACSWGFKWPVWDGEKRADKKLALLSLHVLLLPRIWMISAYVQVINHEGEKVSPTLTSVLINIMEPAYTSSFY